MSLGAEVVKTIGVEGGKSLIKTVAGFTLSLLIMKLIVDNKNLTDDLNYAYDKIEDLEDDLDDITDKVKKYIDDDRYDDDDDYYERRRSSKRKRRGGNRYSRR